MQPVLQIDQLSVGIASPAGTVQAVRGVSLSLFPGEILALVGESGCGKSILCRSIIGLLPKGARIEQGSICLDGTEISACSERQLQALRGRVVSMLLQDPMRALNPTIPVGKQIAEAIRIHEPKLPKGEVQARVIGLMQRLHIPDPQQRCRALPGSFSGGMRQRLALAVALAAKPRLLLADEPTTALDVTVQAQILDLLRESCSTQNTAVILVSHDLSAVARAADRVAILYAGRIVEIGTAEEIYSTPRHPYTRALLQALPGAVPTGEALRVIPGMPPSLIDPPPGDAFACRNEYALEIDYHEAPPMFRLSETHYAASWLLDPRAPDILPPFGGPAHE